MRKERFVSRTWLSEYSECKGAEYQKLASRQGTTQRVSWKTLLRSRRQAFRERADGLIPIQWMIGARCTDERQIIQNMPRNSRDLCIPSLCHSHRHAVQLESTLRRAVYAPLHARSGRERVTCNTLLKVL